METKDESIKENAKIEASSEAKEEEVVENTTDTNVVLEKENACEGHRTRKDSEHHQRPGLDVSSLPHLHRLAVEYLRHGFRHILGHHI